MVHTLWKKWKISEMKNRIEIYVSWLPVMSKKKWTKTFYDMVSLPFFLTAFTISASASSTACKTTEALRDRNIDGSLAPLAYDKIYFVPNSLRDNWWQANHINNYHQFLSEIRTKIFQTTWGICLKEIHKKILKLIK